MSVKTKLLTSVAALSLIGGAAFAQTTATTAETEAPREEMAENAYAPGWNEDLDAAYGDIADRRIPELIGMNVVSDTGDDVGEVDNFVIMGDQVQAVVGVGGFLGLGEHEVALPLSELSYDGEKLIISYTEDELKAMPEYTEELEQTAFGEDDTFRTRTMPADDTTEVAEGDEAMDEDSETMDVADGDIEDADEADAPTGEEVAAAEEAAGDEDTATEEVAEAEKGEVEQEAEEMAAEADAAVTEGAEEVEETADATDETVEEGAEEAEVADAEMEEGAETEEMADADAEAATDEDSETMDVADGDIEDADEADAPTGEEVAAAEEAAGDEDTATEEVAEAEKSEVEQEAEEMAAEADAAVTEGAEEVEETAEATGEAMEEGAEETEEVAENAAEETGEAVEEGTEEVAEAADDAGEAMEEGAEEVADAADDAGKAVGTWEEQLDNEFAQIADAPVADITAYRVVTESGEDVGEIEALARHNDKVVALVGIGGFLGLGEHDVALELSQMEFDGEQFIIKGYTEEELEAMPEYDEEMIERIEGDVTLRSAL